MSIVKHPCSRDILYSGSIYVPRCPCQVLARPTHQLFQKHMILHSENHTPINYQMPAPVKSASDKNEKSIYQIVLCQGREIH